MKKLLLLLIFAFIFQSCGNGTEKKTTEILTKVEEEEEDKAKLWLEDIFKCNTPTEYFCYYLDKEDSLCSKRFIDFLIDANEIYGYSNLTEEERIEAKEKYKKKWSNIYPLYSEEIWLFGRGNDDNENIRDVKVNKISEMKYSVFIDYDGKIKTLNEVTLISENNNFKIDYCKTTFIE